MRYASSISKSRGVRSPFLTHAKAEDDLLADTGGVAEGQADCLLVADSRRLAYAGKPGWYRPDNEFCNGNKCLQREFETDFRVAVGPAEAEGRTLGAIGKGRRSPC